MSLQILIISLWFFNTKITTVNFLSKPNYTNTTQAVIKEVKKSGPFSSLRKCEAERQKIINADKHAQLFDNDFPVTGSISKIPDSCIQIKSEVLYIPAITDLK